MLNLLRNALDAVRPGGTIRVRCGTETGKAVVHVEDDGIGVDQAVRERIFEPFFTTKGDRGTGLGLSTSQWVLRQHDAHIECTSAPGKGTRFVISFTPFTPTEREMPTLDKDTLSVVVVEDDPGVAEMINDMLMEQGHRATVVSSAAAAAEALDRVPADLLLTDLDLPDSSGWDLARIARARRPSMLVGLMTGWPLSATEDEIKGRGIDLVLHKPFSLATLSHALDEARDRTV
jgi:CheY-like chemotaxis protein